jgi:hypothetical protein
MPEMRVPRSEVKKQTEKMKPATKVKITGSASTPPRVSSSMTSSQPKTSSGSMPSDKFVNPIYSRTAGFSPIVPETMPTRTRGAGDANYTKKMKTGQPSKPLPKK